MFVRIALLASVLVLATVTLAVAQSGPTIFDVTTYGAVGDGQTDDTLAIEKATQAWLASPNGGILSFPAGTFMLLQVPSMGAYISATIPSTGTEIVWDIAGAGAFSGQGKATFVVYNSTAASFINVQGESAGGSISGITIIAFEQPGSTTGTNAEIILNQVRNWEITGVLLDVGVGSEVTGVIVQSSHTVMFRNVVFANATLAVVLEGTQDVLLENVLIQGQLASPPLLNTLGVMITDGADDVRVSHCKFQNLAFGVQITGGSTPLKGSSFTDAVFIDIATSGVAIATGGTYTFSNAGFNVTNGVIDSSEGGIVTLPNIQDPLIVSVSNVAFVGQTSGISQLSGSFRISQSLFDSCNFGFYSNISMPTPDISPFQLVHSVFESTVAYPAMIAGGKNWVLADNNCLSGSVSIALTCDNGCVIDNNVNCLYVQDDLKESSKGQKVISQE